MKHLKVGDRVTRLMGGVPMLMEVTEVTDTLIICGAVQKDGKNIFRGGWSFDRETGVEEDHELGWGLKFGKTGSYLVEIT